jgi:hypothetical protein
VAGHDDPQGHTVCAASPASVVANSTGRFVDSARPSIITDGTTGPAPSPLALRDTA